MTQSCQLRRAVDSIYVVSPRSSSHNNHCRTSKTPKHKTIESQPSIYTIKSILVLAASIAPLVAAAPLPTAEGKFISGVKVRRVLTSVFQVENRSPGDLYTGKLYLLFEQSDEALAAEKARPRAQETCIYCLMIPNATQPSVSRGDLFTGNLYLLSDDA